MQVRFSEAVLVNTTNGTPSIGLDVGGSSRDAAYGGQGGGTATLEFLYVVESGDNAPDGIEYAGENALDLNGGTVSDAAGNDAILRLPDPGSRGSLGNSTNIVVDTAPPTILSASAVSRSALHVAFDGPVVSGTAAGIGWSLSGPGAEGLAVGAGAPVPPSAPVTVLELSVVAGAGGGLLGTAPNIALHYDNGTGGVMDEAGNRLPASRDVHVADLIRPGIVGASALITGPNLAEIKYTEPVSAPEGAYSDLYIGRSLRALGPIAAAASHTHTLGFGGGEAPLGSSGNVTIDQTAVLDGAATPNPLGSAADYVLPVFDGRTLAVTSSAITGPGTAVITYTRGAEAERGAYASIVVDGLPRSITSLGGGDGAAEHTLEFSPGGAPAHAAGSVLIDAAAVSASSGGVQLGPGMLNLTLSDGQPPSVRAAAAVSRSAVNVTFDEPVSSEDATGAGWSVSGGDAGGSAIVSTSDISAASAAPLSLYISPDLPGTAPRAVTLSYSVPALGGVVDASGNPLGAVSVGVRDGIAPAIASAAITGPAKVEIAYSEPARAAAGAYKSVSPSDGLGSRPVTGFSESGADTHTISFGGEPAAPGTQGTIRIDGTAVRDLAGNLLGPNPTTRHLVDGQGPAPQPVQEGHAAVERAVFAARNSAVIEYSAALRAPDGYGGGLVYTAVMIDGEGSARSVTDVEGLGTAVHTVSFGGQGIGSGQVGTVVLAVDLGGVAGGGDGGGALLRYVAGQIPVDAGQTVHTVVHSQGQRPPEPVAIEPDGFTRAVDASAAGAGARPAINVTGLAAGTGAPGPGMPDAVKFPAEPVTLSTESASVTFPSNATARQVPAGGVLFMRALPGEMRPSLGDVAAALGYPNASGLGLRGIVEVAGGAGAGPIVFDRPVRIFLADQSGGRAFYANGSAADIGAMAPIDTVCESDGVDAVHDQLGGAGECHLDLPGASGASGKAIYAYHLTLFGTVRTSGVDPGGVDPGGVDPGGVDPGGVDPGGVDPADAPEIRDHAYAWTSNSTADPADAPRPASVFVLQRAGGDPLRAPASYSAGDAIVVAVRFTAPVAVDAGVGGGGGGAPYMDLRTGSAGARAAYSSGGGTDMLEFEYTVRGGDIAS